MTGGTARRTSPRPPGPSTRRYNGGRDAFVTKLNPAGSALVYSTYLGGAGVDAGRGIAVDAAGNAYVTGTTNSPDFPTTAGAFDTTLNGVDDAFVDEAQRRRLGARLLDLPRRARLDEGIGDRGRRQRATPT